jgi:hypothetical protein
MGDTTNNPFSPIQPMSYLNAARRGQQLATLAHKAEQASASQTRHRTKSLIYQNSPSVVIVNLAHDTTTPVKPPQETDSSQ